VAEAAVIGVPDAEFGERPLALVVPHGGGERLAADLLALCQAELSGPKRPVAVEFLDELPRSEAGKLLRRLLKERYSA
jgi:acyl-CoA synthetase (AMP-forming)/AMP-acid ligase II